MWLGVIHSFIHSFSHSVSQVHSFSQSVSLIHSVSQFHSVSQSAHSIIQWISPSQSVNFTNSVSHSSSLIHLVSHSSSLIQQSAIHHLTSFIINFLQLYLKELGMSDAWQGSIFKSVVTQCKTFNFHLNLAGNALCVYARGYSIIWLWVGTSA